MHYMLKGSIAKAHPYQLDKTLTVDGAGADAQATGEAIQAAEERSAESLGKHEGNKTNPHNVNAAQVGLGNCDNTSDMDKPVSTLQAEAIADAMTAADNAQASADNAQASADNAQASADNAQASADNAQAAADNAQTTADSKCSAKAVTVSLAVAGWSNKAQTVTVEGILADTTKCHVIVSPAEASRETYYNCVARCTGQGDGTLTFACDDVPGTALNVNVLILM